MPEQLNVECEMVGAYRHPVEPLFYRVVDGKPYWNSDLAELVKDIGGAPVDYDHLWKWLIGGPVRYTDSTLFQGIKRLYSGEYLWLKPGKIGKVSQSPFVYKSESGRTMESHVQDVGNALVSACRKMPGDFTLLGLSGGLDSRILACAMKKAQMNFSAFTYGFGYQFEEAIIAQQVARRLDVEWDFWQVPGFDYVRCADIGISVSNGESLYKHGVQNGMYQYLGQVYKNIVFGSALDLLIGDSYPYRNISNYLDSTYLFGRSRSFQMFKNEEYESEIWQQAKKDKKDLFKQIPKGDCQEDDIRAFVFDTRVRRWYNANLIYPFWYMNVLLPTYDLEFLDAVSRVPYEYRKGDQFRVALLRYLDKWGVGNINYNATGVPANIDPEIAIMFEDAQRDIENTKEELWQDEGIYIPSYKYEVDLKACYRLFPEFAAFLLDAFEPLCDTLREDYLLKLLAEHVGGKADHMRKLTQLASAGLMLKWARGIIKNTPITA